MTSDCCRKDQSENETLRRTLIMKIVCALITTLARSRNDQNIWEPYLTF